MQDRRQTVRDKVLFGGMAEIGQRGTTTDCVVRNISDRGACIELDPATRLPDEVNLAVARKGRSYLAQIIWRQADKVGLAFRTMFTEPAESDLEERLRRSEKKKRQLQQRINELLGED
jgi:hypothetical protein